MDGGRIAVALGAGLASGIVMLISIHSFMLPFSYMMNRYIYHGPLMRIVAGIVGLVLTVPMFIFLLLNALSIGTLGSFLEPYMPKQHYFGLFPLIRLDSLSEEWQKSTFLKIVLKIINGVTIVWNQGEYEDSIKRVMDLGAKKGVVNEGLFAAARDLAAKGPDHPLTDASPEAVKAAWAGWFNAACKIARDYKTTTVPNPACPVPDAAAVPEAAVPEAAAAE